MWLVQGHRLVIERMRWEPALASKLQPECTFSFSMVTGGCTQNHRPLICVQDKGEGHLTYWGDAGHLLTQVLLVDFFLDLLCHTIALKFLTSIKRDSLDRYMSVCGQTSTMHGFHVLRNVSNVSSTWKSSPNLQNADCPLRHTFLLWLNCAL